MTGRNPIRLFLWLVFGTAISLAVSPLLAQSALPLTGVASAHIGTYNMIVSYPEGWVTFTADNEILMATSDDAMTEFKAQGYVSTAGQEGIVVFLPSFLDKVGASETASPDDAINAYLKSTKTQGKITESSDFSVPAATTVIVTPDHPGMKAVLGALAFPDGTAMFAVVPDSAYDATALAVLNSLTVVSDSSLPALTEESTQSSSAANTVTYDMDRPAGTYQLAVNVPPGWSNRPATDLFYVGSSEAAVQTAYDNGSNYAAGDIAISIILPEGVDQLGIDSTTSPVDVLNKFITVTKFKGSVTPDTDFSGAAAYALITDAKIPGGSADIYAIATDGGTLVAVIQPSGKVDDTVLAVLKSIKFELVHTAEPQATFAPPATEAATAVPQSAKVIEQWASSADGTSEYGTDDWSFAQATGKPDTQDCGDTGTAWASDDATGRAVLKLDFAQPVLPSQINIYQTFNPGAIVEVDVGNNSDPNKVLPLPKSADAPGNTDCPGVFLLNVSGVDTPVDFVVLYLDQSLTQNWDEIDAVQLVGTPAN